MSSLVQPLLCQGFVSPPHSPPTSLPSFQQLVPMQLHSTLARFDGVKTNILLGVFHESTKEDKGK
jgi:hypothetical protein